MNDFRFEQLEIWRDSIVISDRLFEIAEVADKKKIIQICGAIKGCCDEHFE